MTVLNIRHRTTYRYRESVRLGPHRLMLRPRESRDVRLLSSTLETTPAASVSWTNDVFGNAVATAAFAGLADGLTIESRAAVELGASPWPVFDIAASANSTAKSRHEPQPRSMVCKGVCVPSSSRLW